MKTLLSGVDSLYLNFDISFNQNVLNTFDEVKNVLENDEVEQVQLGNVTFEFKSYGTRGYEFLFDSNLFQIAFTSNDVNYPNTRVQVKSFALWSNGVEECYSEVKSALEDLGVIVGESISRVDLCVDMQGVHDYFTSPSLMVSDEVVTRARKRSSDSDCGEINYWGIGSRGGKIFARIYNKSGELFAKNHKKFFFEKWGVEEEVAKENPVWRVEFELKRDLLRQMNINTFDDLIQKMSGLWEYLVGNGSYSNADDLERGWLSFRQPSADSNKTRWDLFPFWELVQSVSIDFQGEDAVVRDYRTNGDMETLISMMKGCFTSLGAVMKEYDERVALEKVINLLLSELGGDYLSEVEEKYIQYNYQVA